MRERVTQQVDYDEEQYNVKELLNSSKTKKRLDLNDLLQRAKIQEKSDKKINFLIYSGAIAVVAIFVLFISL